jgi:hypothetical protein
LGGLGPLPFALVPAMMPRHERPPITGNTESDTAAFVALYSALIQGGATILAVIGRFLFTFGPVSRSRSIRYEQLQREAQRSMAEPMAPARNLGEAARRRREQADAEQIEEEDATFSVWYTPGDWRAGIGRQTPSGAPISAN